MIERRDYIIYVVLGFFYSISYIVFAKLGIKELEVFFKGNLMAIMFSVLLFVYLSVRKLKISHFEKVAIRQIFISSVMTLSGLTLIMLYVYIKDENAFWGVIKKSSHFQFSTGITLVLFLMEILGMLLALYLFLVKKKCHIIQ